MKTKISGVNSGRYREQRQATISNCRPGDLLLLKREKDNPADSNAVAVFVPGKLLFFIPVLKQIGYLNRKVAEQVAADMDGGFTVICRVLSVTGGGDYTYGLNVEVDTE